MNREVLPIAVLILTAPLIVAAQGAVATARITTEINENRLMTLTGHMHPLARPQNDQGKADPSLRMERITIVFQQTTAQKADLEALLAAQQNPTSPSFHQWLTPQQYGDRFGVAPADLANVTSWLQGHGFNIVETPPSRNLVVFEGTAAQVESAFHTEIHNYATKDGKFYANSAEPSIPAALAGVVAGFKGLNNYQMKPRSRTTQSSGSLHPHYTTSSGAHLLAPGDFATIYDLNSLYGASPAIDGTGQSIVIVGQSNIVLADIAAFRAASGLAAKAPTVTLVPGSTDPGVLSGTGDEQESSLDIEWSGAVARNATVKFVYSTNAFTSLQYAITQNIAPVISISYGQCEATFSVSDINTLVALGKQANAQGITIVASSGDGGASDCDGNFGNYPAILGLSVDLPASLPYVTGVGGTEFNEGTGTYWTSTNTSGVVSSALSYIPEQAWNDTSSANSLASGGGGASILFGKPTWQTGTGVPNDGFRDVPDVSLNASNMHDPYLICVQFIPQGGTTFTSNCLNNTFQYSDGSLEAGGGTSFAAPSFAGIVALINQKTGTNGQGNINYILYPLAASSPTAFHDVTTGDNTSPCVAGSQDCPPAGRFGFAAATGYDQATGLGSIDGTNLVNAWQTISTGAGTIPVLSSISPTSTTAGSIDFTLTANGSSFTTNAQILWNGSATGVTMQSGGTATSIKATIAHTLVAFGATTAAVSVTDDPTKAAASSASQAFTVNASQTPPANDNVANAFVVTPGGNYTSTVDNSAATTESTDPSPPCALSAPIPSTNPRLKTVWWTVTPTSNTSLIASTIGSSYDTTLSVWTGTPGSLTNVACNDDVVVGQYTQSLVSFSATSGTKYYIMVAPFGPPSDQNGGKTVLNVSIGTLSSISAAPNSQTVAAGYPATYAVTDIGTVAYTLTCSGLPKGASCGSVAVGANATVPLVISTTSRTSSIPPSGPTRQFPIDARPWLLLALAISVLIVLAARKRSAKVLVSASALGLLLLFAALGCGSSYNNGGGTPNPNGTPAGSYTITITGTSGSSTQTTQVNLIVT